VQRLVRRICPQCAAQGAPADPVRRWFATLGMDGAKVPHAVGCEACHGSGYKGRIVLAEIHAVDDRLRDLVTMNEPVSRLREHVAASGVVSLQVQAARMVLAGMTTAEEVKRVVGWQ
jgi:general secretion pathway protein E